MIFAPTEETEPSPDSTVVFDWPDGYAYDGGPRRGSPHPRSFGTFPRILGSTRAARAHARSPRKMTQERRETRSWIAGFCERQFAGGGVRLRR